MTGTLGQFARFYSTFLFSYLAVAVLLCLKIQLRTIGLEGSCSFIFTALIGGIQPYVILAIAEMTSKVLG